MVSTTATTASYAGPQTIDGLIREQEARLGSRAHDDGDISGGDTTLLGQQVNILMRSQAFLDAGKKTGVWFELTPAMEKQIWDGADAEDAQGTIDMLRSIMGTINGVLARADMTDAAKLTFMSSMFGEFNGKYDDDGREDAWKGLGTVIAQVMAGDAHALFSGDNIEVEELSDMLAGFPDALSKHLVGQQIAVQEDTAMAWLAEHRETSLEQRRRRATMTPQELQADFQREADEKASLRDRQTEARRSSAA